jgi:hypothetical protein
MDPFTSHNTVVLFCDILDAVKNLLTKEIQEELLKKLKNI